MTRAVAVVLAVAAAVLFTARATYDPDLFWHLAQGREVFAGHLVRANLFSAPFASHPQAYTSWGYEALLAGAVRAFGLGGVEVVQATLIAASLFALYLSARARHSALAALAAVIVSLFVLEPRAMPRPYLVSWLALALTVHFWEGRPEERRESAFATLCLLLVVWANFHSEVVFGFAFLVIVVMLEEPRRWPWLLAAATATVLTPYGTGLWRYLAENAFVPQVLRIAELQAPSPQTYPAFFLYLAVLAVLLLSDLKRLRPAEVVTVLVFAALGLRYIRLTPMIVFVAAPMLAARVDAMIARGWDRRAVVVTATALAIVMLPASPVVMARAMRVGSRAVEPPDVFSAAAIDYARAHALSGPVFTSMNLGGWVAWHLPDARVSLDTRLQAYPSAQFTAVLNASSSPAQWKELVRGYDWAVVSVARPNELSGVGQFSAEEWASVFRDRAVEIYVRRAGAFGALAR